MKRETKCDERSDREETVDCGLSETDATSRDEAELLLSEDGEARRRFLKQALIAGGGLAAGPCVDRRAHPARGRRQHRSVQGDADAAG